MATQTELTQAQHVFLQAMMARCVMSETDARAMYAEIVGADVARADARGFDRFWGEIASQLGYLDLDLRRVKYQDDDELYLGIVNKVASDSAKLATTMTPEQIALFRVVLDEILREDATCDAKNGGVDVISALNATQIWTGATQGATQGGEGGATQLTQAQTESVAKMSKTEKEATLKRLCEEGWLRRGDDEAGKLTIGVRSFLELKEFLLESAPEATQERWKLLM